MASIKCIETRTVHNSLMGLKPTTINKSQQQPNAKQEAPVVVVLPVLPISRRSAILMSPLLPLGLISLLPKPSLARERRNRKTIPIEDYLTSRWSLIYLLLLLTLLTLLLLLFSVHVLAPLPCEFCFSLCLESVDLDEICCWKWKFYCLDLMEFGMGIELVGFEKGDSIWKGHLEIPWKNGHFT